jgi:4-amino-4-deoxy-L-arabinose transferase-like glycosyltransferase
MKQIVDWIKKKKILFLFSIPFLALIFFRFSFIEQRSAFSWDQVINAWAAKDILIDHRILLLGMPAKLNSGFSIGPLYYYYDAIFYWLFHMDPIAVGYIAGVTSIITFFALFFVSKKLFSTPVAFFTVFLYAFSFAITTADRYQWPVNFITAVSVLIFYFLYRVITGHPRNFIGLAITLGLSFQIHFTSIFYPLIIILALPFIPWNKKTVKYFFLSIPLFLIWFVPQALYEIQNKGAEIHNLFSYNQHYNHGFHFRRMFQIAPDIFLEYTTLLSGKIPSYFSFILLPLFIVVYLWKDRNTDRVKLIYLVLLWVLVPWIIFSLYMGELTDYYFSVIRPIALLTTSYLIFMLFSFRYFLVKVGVLFLLLGFAYVNTSLFLTTGYQGLYFPRQIALDAIKKGEAIQYAEGVPQVYFYYIYTHGYGLK